MQNKFLKLVGIASLAALFTFSTTAQAQKGIKKSPLNNTEVFAKFSLGFAGGAAPGFSVGADTSIGGPSLNKYLRIGGAFQGHFALGAAALDIDAQFRPQYQIPVSRGYLAVYALVPLGLNITIVPAGGGFFGAAGGTAFGIHYGLVPGARYFFNEHWGVAVELGLDLHSTFGTLGATAVTGIWNVGGMYAF